MKSSLLAHAVVSLVAGTTLVLTVALSLEGQSSRDAAPPRPQEPAGGRGAGGTGRNATPDVPLDKTLRDFDGDCNRSGCHRQIQSSVWTHGPVAVGACDVCHAPIQGEIHKFQYRRPREQLCTYCHVVAPPEGVVHPPYSSGKCTSCHGPHGGYTTTLLRAPSVAELCGTCHNGEREPDSGKVLRDILGEIASRKYPHGPVREGNCGACHYSHASEFPRLLRGNYPRGFYAEFEQGAYDFCFKCHDRRLASEENSVETGFRDGFRNLHYLHVNRQKGRTCLICHDVHASDSEKLIRADVAFGSGGWRLPIGFEKSADGGSCETGCHRKMVYARAAAPTPGAPTPGAPTPEGGASPTGGPTGAPPKEKSD